MGASDRPGDASSPTETRVATVDVDVTAAFREHYRFVWRVLVSAGVPRSGVDDAVQDVFVTVHRRRRDYDGRAPLRHWIYGIARGVGRNHGRKASRKALRVQALDGEERATPALATTAGQETEVARRQAKDLVAAFVETLSDEQREVFTLVHMEGMAVPDIAAMLGAPVNTIYSRLRLARQRFEAMVASVRAGEGTQ
ncbi:MAG: sigma-70 family RNA polymerase sigma factor [Myxococcota bacterium]